MDDTWKFCNRLAFYRKERGLTQVDLAFICKCSRNIISAIESGLYNPSSKLAYSLCLALQVDFFDMFYFKENI